MESILSLKRDYNDFDNRLCILCQDDTNANDYVKNPNSSSYDKLLECAKKRNLYKDKKKYGCYQPHTG